MTSPLRFTVVLATHLDPDDYAARYESGNAPDRFPYGLENVPTSLRLTLSRPTPDSRLPLRLRRLFERWFGFDLAHAWRNRRSVLDSDAVYAHTEREYLGAAFVLLVHRNRRVVLCGQTIWLFENLHEYPAWRRAVITALLRRVDVLVYNAKPNVSAGAAVHRRGEHVYVPFGVSKVFGAVRREPALEPLVLSVGIDRSRDWPTLGSALAAVDERGRRAEVRVAAKATIPELPQAVIGPTGHFSELLELYSRATCVVVSTTPNLHASGITTLMEAAAAGVPIIATATGGLEDYFTADEVAFVPPGDAPTLAGAIARILDEPQRRDRFGAAARAAWLREGYDSTAYWQRIAELLLPAVAARTGSARGQGATTATND